MNRKDKKWDVFIAHASEDKDDFVSPLAVALQSLGLRVWYDDFSLTVGDSLSRSIDKGLRESAYGLVVISPSFIGKAWPERELRGLVSREIDEGEVILPIWHGVTRKQVLEFSPPLADVYAINTAWTEAQDAAIQLLKKVRPDLYEKHPRADLEKIASGEAISELQQEIEQMREELESAHEELSQYQCPYCRSPLIARIHAPVDSEEQDWADRETYECGYQSFGGSIEHPCPSDPEFPTLDEYELRMLSDSNDDTWICIPRPKTQNARKLRLGIGEGKTAGEAKEAVSLEYNWYARKPSKSN